MPVITKPKISPELLAAVKTSEETEKQVIVHCCFPATPLADMLIRIWSSTYLIDENSGHKSGLIHYENISLFPYWTLVPPMRDYWFTLVFSGLPKECTRFKLEELIPQEGGFLVSNIPRNASDIYRVHLS